MANRFESYINLIKAEHRELCGLVNDVEKSLDLAEHGNWSKATTAALLEMAEHLTSHMEQHFAREEEGGYLEEALLFAPEFRDRADELLSQHKQMRDQLSGLLAATVKLGPGDPRWPAMAEKLRQFLDDVLAHEAAENQILQRAFNTGLDLG